jgi:hypothetical protein
MVYIKLLWNQKLDEKMSTLGFAKRASDSAIYCCGIRSERLIVGVYVDDLVIAGSSVSSIKRFKDQMSSLFKMSDLGLLSYYLRIEVKQGGDGISLSQGNYARKILEKAGLEGCKSCVVPMQQKLKLSKESNTPIVDATGYRSLGGSLRYLVNTRLDFAFSVGYINRYMEEPHEEHLSVKHVLIFVAGTCDTGLFYPRKKDDSAEIIGYTNSDLDGTYTAGGAHKECCSSWLEAQFVGSRQNREWWHYQAVKQSIFQQQQVSVRLFRWQGSYLN